ncbi:hypothetical protein [Candidatus Clavichlamydia salmonicola]|uniref:hypothetical protein n=1 Tax=Candidatus Clavichlamydia salmonicola TaxID=469812 RepID=UPI0018918C40|nr:hypothetical protein [Candidatus Clavichlamydia salmonicola]
MKLTSFAKKIVWFFITSTILPLQLSASPALINQTKDVVIEKTGRFKDIFTSSKNNSYSTRAQYAKQLSATVKADLTYILNLCAKGSLGTLSKAEGELKQALSNLKTAHPLRVLLTVFKEEALKKDLLKIRDRTMVWNVLTKKMKENFSKDANFSDSDIKSFASSMGVKAENIVSLLSKQRWADLIATLLDNG